jgi:hypothetical protein
LQNEQKKAVAELEKTVAVMKEQHRNAKEKEDKKQVSW